MKSDRFFRNMMRAIRTKNRRRARYWAGHLAKFHGRHGVPV